MKRTTWYMHKVTIKRYDYGDLIDTEECFGWSTNGLWFDSLESGNYEEIKADKLSGNRPEWLDIVEGKPLTHKIDINPHGFM